MKTIAITGASGFVGRHLLSFLQEKGGKATALLRGENTAVSADRVVYGDLITGKGLDQFLQGADTVINLVGRFEPPFEDQLKGNVLTLSNLCEVAVKQGVKKVIHVSSAAVYGVPSNNRAFRENDPPQPDTTYGLSKKLAEEVAAYYYHKHDLKFVILRPPNVYGPGNDHGVVFNFAKAIKEKGGVIVHGKGEQKRDFLFVGDLVEAIGKSVNLEADFEIFNITSGQAISLMELVRVFEEALGKRVKVSFKGEAQGAKVIWADNSKAQKMLDWSPKVSLEEGIRLTFSTL